MSNPDQEALLNSLARQQHNQAKVDRILKIIVPITAFLLSVICANLNWQSTLGTFLMLYLAFYAVAIKRFTLWHWLVIVSIYALIDNYLSYGQFTPSALRLQLACMLVFTMLFGLGRPYMDRWIEKQ